MSSSRRSFLALAGSAVPAGSQVANPLPSRGGTVATFELPLPRVWHFRLETAPFDKARPAEAFRKQDHQSQTKSVAVPHTWQTDPASAGHMGAGWYYAGFDAPALTGSGVFRLEFEAIYHSAWIFINGEYAGNHLRKGYTAFELDITRLVRPGQTNQIAVRAENSFDAGMLPRGDSFDWTPDGGIYRPVHLRLSPAVWIRGVQVSAEPDGDSARCTFTVDESGNAPGPVEVRVIEDGTGRLVYSGSAPANRAVTVRIPARPWHFDDPQLYSLEASLPGGDRYATTFGSRRFEVRDGGFFLNGERVRLAGVERMAGSHPAYGMAEPLSWIEHDHADMKELNCVFTRVHWAQDRRVLDYCDRHGIMIQLEVPTWGPNTFKEMDRDVAPPIMQNGIEQLREMIARDHNHPSVVAWGLCNEVDGRRPAVKQFIRNMAAEARRLDPTRPLTYASNTLQSADVANDAAGELDFVSWNEYYESWYGGSPRELRANLERIEKAFPGKPIVISEYGYCACTPERPEGDAKRIDVLREHDAIFRESAAVGGLIFFDYNDYRTHIGDKGLGVLKQRVHGVVDVYGNRKPSFEALRREHSPVAGITLTAAGSGLTAVVRTSRLLPAYTLRGYRLRWVVFGGGDIPLETGEAALPDLAPGAESTMRIAWQEKAPRRVLLDVLRPTGFSAWTEVWKPTVS